MQGEWEVGKCSVEWKWKADVFNNVATMKLMYWGMKKCIVSIRKTSKSCSFYLDKARCSIEIDIYILKRQFFTAKYMQYMLRWSDVRFGMFQPCFFYPFRAGEYRFVQYWDAKSHSESSPALAASWGARTWMTTRKRYMTIKSMELSASSIRDSSPRRKSKPSVHWRTSHVFLAGFRA